MRRLRTVHLAGIILVLLARSAAAQTAVQYVLSFPEPEHRWMQVEATFSDVPSGPFDLHMSRSSPGRYALHEFAKNVFSVEVTDPSGKALTVTRPSPHRWLVADHGSSIRVRYRVFGDRVDGTYLGIDSTHAHINMPSALMWASGLEQRPVTVRFVQPQGASWRVATQLFDTGDALTFSAPNLQYLMDSPTEFSAFDLRTFSIPDAGQTQTFRLAIHHQGEAAVVDAFAVEAERMVREARNVFGEFPPFEGNTYTFILDYVPWASGDAMEHRNSTFVTSAAPLGNRREDHLGSLSHEFFHAWNVERIRPRSLEPFNFDEANMSAELWLAEGVTNYYGPLILHRAGLMTLADFAAEIGDAIDTVVTSPARRLRTAEEMSRFAPFVDAATSIDRTNFSNAFISYYTWGEAIGVGLDLALRERSNGAITLDHFMRELWRRFGKPGGKVPGVVDNPYTPDDVRAVLAEVSGDRSFAEEFFTRYVRGHDVVDYSRLLALAGLAMRPVNPGAGYAGAMRLQDASGGARIVAAVPFGSPAYAAGLERDDLVVSVAGSPVGSATDLENLIRSRPAGSEVPIVFERRGRRVQSNMRIVEDPHQEVVPFEVAGRTLSETQRRFRESWLRSR